MATGSPQGCTASTIVFDVAFQLILDYLEFLTPKVKPFNIKDTSVEVKYPTYADDIALVTETPDDNQVCIDAFSKATDWTVTMKAKPKKCFSLAFRLFKKGEKSCYKKVLHTQYSSFDPLLNIKGHQLQFIGSLPKGPPMFKYLGCFIQYDLGTNHIVEQLQSRFVGWLKLVDETLLPGPQKAWIANRYVCMKVAWILMVHSLPLGVINKLHRLLHAHYRKWIGLAKCMEPSVLYRSRENFGLNFMDLRRLYRDLQVSRYHILKYSKDEQIKHLYVHLLKREQKRKNSIPSLKRPPRKKSCKVFSGPLELERLEGIVASENVTRNAQSDRKGLGYNLNSRKKLSDRERIMAVRKEEAEHKWKILSLAYKMQGEWLQFTDHMMTDDLSWDKILWGYSDRLLKFLVNATANTLPSPDNLKRWNPSKSYCCGLCGAPNATQAHILAGCNWVRMVENKSKFEDRYTWRHNCVLVNLIEALVSQLKVANARPRSQKNSARMMAKSILDDLVYQKIDKRTAWSRIKNCQFLHTSLKQNGPISSLDCSLKDFLSESIKFVKPSGKPAKSITKRAISGILDEANDWKIDSDLPEFQRETNKFVFPFWICPTDLKPDCVIFSMERKICIIVEVTAPMDVNIDKWHSIKLEKYQVGIQQEADKNWTVSVFPIEVGARGFVHKRVHGYFLKLGIDGRFATSTIRKMSHMARRCSYVIWIHRFNQDFKPFRLNGSSAADEAKKSNLIYHRSMSANDSTQKNKTRAPVILASKQNGNRGISVSTRATDVASASVKIVKWSDMLGGSLTDVRTYTLNLTELQQKREYARYLRKQRIQHTQVGPETLFRDPTLNDSKLEFKS